MNFSGNSGRSGETRTASRGNCRAFATPTGIFPKYENAFHIFPGMESEGALRRAQRALASCMESPEFSRGLSVCRNVHSTFWEHSTRGETLALLPAGRPATPPRNTFLPEFICHYTMH